MFRELRRKRQELSQEECIRILQEETRGILSVCGEDGYPYGMPMNHFYDDSTGKIYFHCGYGGHRLDALKQNNKVSFCVCDQGVRDAGAWAWKVKSVIVFGHIDVVDDLNQVIEMTRKLSYKFTQDEQYIQQEIAQAAHRTLLLALTPEHLCGKVVTEA